MFFLVVLDRSSLHIITVMSLPCLLTHGCVARSHQPWHRTNNTNNKPQPGGSGGGGSSTTSSSSSNNNNSNNNGGGDGRRRMSEEAAPSAPVVVTLNCSDGQQVGQQHQPADRRHAYPPRGWASLPMEAAGTYPFMTMAAAPVMLLGLLSPQVACLPACLYCVWCVWYGGAGRAGGRMPDRLAACSQHLGPRQHEHQLHVSRGGQARTQSG